MLCYVIVSLSSIVIISLGEREFVTMLFYVIVSLSSIVVISLGEEGIGYYALLCYCWSL